MDYYISFDNEQVGELQGESLVEKLAEAGAKAGPIVMINGAPTDNNAKLFKAGAHCVLKSRREGRQGVRHAGLVADKAQQEMEQAITALGKGGFDGVYAANDGTGGGAIAAMKSARHGSEEIPVTGQDAELAAIQRIRRRAVHDGVQGDQARGRGGGSSPSRSVQGEEPARGARQRQDGQRPEAGARPSC